MNRNSLGDSEWIDNAGGWMEVEPDQGRWIGDVAEKGG